jgi:hypothetical protein
LVPTAWPVPIPLVVQPAAASASNEAPASLIEKAFIVSYSFTLNTITANRRIGSNG